MERTNMISSKNQRGNKLSRTQDSMKIKVTTHEEKDAERRVYWRSRTPEERLSEVERLRQEAFKFLPGGYPAKMQRVVTITYREPKSP